MRNKAARTCLPCTEQRPSPNADAPALHQLSFSLSCMTNPPPTRCWTDGAEVLMPFPVGPLPAVAIYSGFAAGSTGAGAATTTCLPLQDSVSAEATDETPAEQRAVPTVQSMTPAKA